MNHPSILKAFEQVAAELEAMDIAEFQAMLEKHQNQQRCMPDQCHGACQGMGWCYVCEEFRGELPDDHMEDLLP